MTQDHYFSADPRAAARPTSISFTVAGRSYELSGAAGVFSAGRLDPGTAVLLRKAELPTGPGPLLDLGCGYGPIACVLATQAPRATVYAVDVNTRALDLTRANAESLGIGGRIVAALPDDIPAELAFAEIWSNPPIHVGKAELHALLLRWLPRLAPGGRAWLVVARHLGADSLVGWLGSAGFDVARHASQQGFRVLTAKKSGDSTAAGQENL